MKILHVVAANRWSGAAAPAFSEVEALRAAGIEAYYAYVGGYRLEQKLAHADDTHPLIARRENPVAIARSLRALARFIDRHGIDIVHSHLTYDHALATVVAWRRPALGVVRTYHSRRAVRRDPLSRLLQQRSDAICVINAALVAGEGAEFTPPPVDHRLFHPGGADARRRLGIPESVPVIGTIGKIAPRRGFEEVIRTFALVLPSRPEARLLIIGHGPHRPRLEGLARSLAVDSNLVWAGYHEADLADYLRAMSVLLFTREGSDEGHRAVTEALACGVPAACYPLLGIRSLLGSLAGLLTAESSEPAALAGVALNVLDHQLALRERCIEATSINSYIATAERLNAVYRAVLSARAS